MLLFAVFTLGYFFGVFLTLFVLMRKEAVEEYTAPDKALDLANSKPSGSWEIFTQLTKINFPKSLPSKSTKPTVLPAQ